MRERAGIARIRPERSHTCLARKKHVQSASVRTDPQRSVLVLSQCCDPVVGKPGGIQRGSPEGQEVVAVPPVQSVLRTDPHKPVAVLVKRVHGALAQALLDRNAIETGNGYRAAVLRAGRRGAHGCDQCNKRKRARV